MCAVDVGNWTKRGYVAGGTLAAALYTFHDVDEKLFPDGLRLQMDIRLFRTTKEGLNRPILGSIVLRHPLTGLASAPRNFAAREYFTLDQFIPRKLTDPSGKPLDLFKDLVHDGSVVMELQCIPRSQFFGVGPADVYLLAREGRFDVNFAKAFAGIWLQMVLTVVIGVTWSTFLSGSVAMLATAVSIFGAVLKPALIKVAEGNLYGTSTKSGGMMESAVRCLRLHAAPGASRPGWRGRASVSAGGGRHHRTCRASRFRPRADPDRRGHSARRLAARGPRPQIGRAHV